MDQDDWIDVGSAAELQQQPLQQVMLGKTCIALVHKDGRFSASSGSCNHVGGPLGEGRLEGNYVERPAFS